MISSQATVQSKYLQRGGTGQQADQSFIKSGDYASSFTSYLVGGDPALAYELSKWPEWIESFFNSPALIHDEGFKIVLGNLTDFIKNKTIAANVNMAIAKYFADNPYPEGPQCQESVLCPDGQAQECCSLGQTCCQESCYESWDDTCCNPGACGQGVDCCGPGPVCCDPSDSTCCSTGCYEGASDTCCSGGQGGGACGLGATCCDGSCDGTPYCCSDGHGCLCILGVAGCDPLDTVWLPSSISTKHELSKHLKGTGLAEQQFMEQSISFVTERKEEKLVKQMKPEFPFNIKESTFV